MGEFRGTQNILEGGDPSKKYRWFGSKSESGQRILNAMRAGWQMVNLEEEGDMQVGDEFLTKSSSFGTIVKRPANKSSSDEWQYLMWMPMRDWEAVQAMKNALPDEKERAIAERASEEGLNHPRHTGLKNEDVRDFNPVFDES